MLLATAETAVHAPGMDDVPAAERIARYFHPDLHGILDDAERTRRARALRLPQGLALEAPLGVRVEHGRWLVDCPDCNGAQFASRKDLRFWCVDCRNAAVGGLWRRVAWPDDAEQAEQVLAARPLQATRNWRPGREALDDLARENQAHGLPGSVA